MIESTNTDKHFASAQRLAEVIKETDGTGILTRHEVELLHRICEKLAAGRVAEIYGGCDV